MNLDTFDWPAGLRLFVALGLGLLVGMEREGSHPEDKRPIVGGVRTFPLVSMYAFACAWLSRSGIPFILPAGLASIAALAAVSYMAKIRIGRLGATTEISLFVTFVTGALALLTDLRLAMALGVCNALLLSEKATLESWVERLDKVEFLAIVKFLIVTVIIYPALPNQEFTAYRLNPSRIWQIVMVVSSVGFVGYFLTRKFGHRVGLWLSGLLGGIVSSTAVSVAAGRIAQKNAAQGPTALQATLLASSVMYLRVLALIGFMNPAALASLWKPMAVLFAVGVLMSLGIRPAQKMPASDEPTSLRNPFEIQTALVFAALFVGLTVLTGFARDYLGGAGVLSLAGLVGVVDVDPFILSVVQGKEAASTLMCQAVLVAVMSNTLMKGLYFSVLARPVRQLAIRRYVFWFLLHLPLLWAV
jgi:uncharacterized membrane protein (DUF4010 family)